jgi:Calcineurin-like phosphoesterase
MSFTIASYVKDTFDGMLVFADVHGDFESYKRARDFAIGENFLFMSLGDLVDRARHPFEIVESMYNMMYAGRAGFTIGNHDDKHYRGIMGNKVSFSKDARQTLSDVGEERMSEFHKMYKFIIEDNMLSGVFHKFDDITLVHAASHPCLWEDGTEVGKTARSRFLVGETNGEKYDDGYPVRLYNWIDEIPMGKTVMVGHDKQPINNIPIHEPKVVTNRNGGKAIFMDTGCGKGGFLSGAVILHGKKGFVIDRFVEFK